MRRVLEARYGVDASFTSHLAPLLERFEASAPSAEERDHLVRSLVAAYRHRGGDGAPSADELQALIEDAAAEFRKIDESLKVLTVYLLRIRRSLRPEDSNRVVH
jgi:hypothetical protein